MMNENWWLYWSPDPASIDLFDSLTTTAGTSNVVAETDLQKSALEQYAAPLAIASVGLQGFASAWAGKTRIENLYTNIDRTKRNIDQMELALKDTLEMQARKVSRRHGTQMAKIGASGVGFGGSPLLVMMESHARGMQDYDAIHQKGMFAIDQAYDSIYSDLKQAKDIGTSMIVGGISTAARGAFGVATL
jgi:hypothetical protein